MLLHEMTRLTTTELEARAHRIAPSRNKFGNS